MISDDTKYLIIAGCSYSWKCNIEKYPNDVPEFFLQNYKIITIGLGGSSIEFIKESIIHKVGELLNAGIDSSKIYVLSNLTNIGRHFIKYPEHIHKDLSDEYKEFNTIGKHLTSSLITTIAAKPKYIKNWEIEQLSNIQSYKLPIQNFEIYLESIVILQSFLKKHNIANTFYLMNNVFEGWSANFKHTYSNLTGPIVPNLDETLHIKDMSEYCGYLWDLIDLDTFVFHKTIGNNYGGIDEYAIEKFNGDGSVYFDNPTETNNYWYGQHPMAPVYASFSNEYKINDKIINNLK
jgi:hypothetical protein